MTKLLGARLVLIAAVVLLLLNLMQLDFHNLAVGIGPLSGILSNLLLIIAMGISIRDLKKKENP